MKSAVCFLFFVLLAACAHAPASAAAPEDPTRLAPDEVVARIGKEPITAAKLDRSIRKKLADASRDYEKNVYQLRHDALEEMIDEQLVDAEAKKAKMDPDAWLEQQLKARAPPPTDAELQKFYDAHKDDIGKPLDLIKPQLSEFLRRRKMQRAMQSMVDELRKQAGIVILLRAPPVPRVKIAGSGPSRGDAMAPVTIVEFADYQCPFCSRAEATLAEVMQHYCPGNKAKSCEVRMVFRNYPLPFHDRAQKAAEAALCAQEQGKFWAMHDALYAHQDQLAVADLKKTARALGMDGKKFDRCLDSGAEAAAVSADKKDGDAAGVDGTPTFFIDGQLLSGAQPFDRFQQLIDADLKAPATAHP